MRALPRERARVVPGVGKNYVACHWRTANDLVIARLNYGDELSGVSARKAEQNAVIWEAARKAVSSVFGESDESINNHGH